MFRKTITALASAATLGQRLDEVMAGAWIVVPAKADLLFSDPTDLWSTLVKGGDL
jgi:putative AlgH/UPF0301 family transcriptional regulator